MKTNKLKFTARKKRFSSMPQLFTAFLDQGKTASSHGSHKDYRYLGTELSCGLAGALRYKIAVYNGDKYLLKMNGHDDGIKTYRVESWAKQFGYKYFDFDQDETAKAQKGNFTQDTLRDIFFNHVLNKQDNAINEIMEDLDDGNPNPMHLAVNRLNNNYWGIGSLNREAKQFGFVDLMLAPTSEFKALITDYARLASMASEQLSNRAQMPFWSERAMRRHRRATNAY